MAFSTITGYTIPDLFKDIKNILEKMKNQDLVNTENQSPKDEQRGEEEIRQIIEKSGINMNYRYAVAKYIYDDVIRTLTPYTIKPNEYVSRETEESLNTILCYFGDTKRALSGGYASIISYLSNRFGVPTIIQKGEALERDANGNITGRCPHSWNISQMEDGQWYFIDATAVSPEIPNLLKGQGNGGNSRDDFRYYHEPTTTMLYPEIAPEDYPHPTPLRHAMQTRRQQ
jgi:hypothetical protein